MDNTSGQGKGAALPVEAQGLCWSGFFWNWLWGPFNKVWFSLLVFVPFVGFLVPFVLLFKGRQWAWENKAWENVEHFNRVQRNWTIAGLLLIGVSLLAGVLAIVFMGSLFSDSEPTIQAQSRAAEVRAAPRSVEPPAVATPVSMKTPAAPPAPAVPSTQPTPAVAAPVQTAALAPAPSSQASTAAIASAKDKPRLARRVARPRAELRPMAHVSAPEPKIHTPAYNDLMTAVLRPDRAGVTELLDLGRWVDKPDSYGATSLMAAVRLRDQPMAALLLARGANPNASSASGTTPFSIARTNGDAAMAALLQRSGAK